MPLSATQLSGFFECQHLTWLELGVARGTHQRPGQNELERWMLEYRGRAHEARLLALYRAQGLEVVELPGAPARDAEGRQRAVDATLAALERGADVVYQGTLQLGAWSGRPDFLKKAPGPSRFGDFHYEVVDAKLAQHAQARALIQLCVYTEQLAALQGALPERFWIAIGGSTAATEVRAPIELRTLDYLAYYRQSKARFESFISDPAVPEPYPEPVEHCDVCRWWKECETRRRKDDHLALVAGSTRRQRDRLGHAGIATMAALAELGPERPVAGIDVVPLRRLREQARLQVAARATGTHSYELLRDAEPGSGLERLPEPTPGDLFLDLEGDAYALGEGIEYLFGLLELGEPSLGWSRREKPGAPRQLSFWSQNRPEEKRAFEAVLRRIERGRNEFPALHVFHFGQREIDALKKLSCRHATMEDQVDRLLREHVLVDLHAVVRQSLRASVEGYTLKQLEALYGFERSMNPRRAALAMQRYGFWLETGEALGELEEERAVLTRYNEEDCRSAWQLRDWLEQRRPELERQTGLPLRRPVAEATEISKERKARSAEAANAVEELQAGLPDDARQDSAEQNARRVLSHLIGWHWREEKSTWWEHFRAKELPANERLDDRLVLDGLVYERTVRPIKRSEVLRFRFPEQEHSLRRVPRPHDPDADKAVEVVEIGSSHVDIKRGKASTEPHPRSLIVGKPINTDAQQTRLLHIAQCISRRGFDAARDEFPAARALLLRLPPAVGQEVGQVAGAPLLAPDEDTVAGVVRLTLALEPGVLAVQGPPGSGKTHRAVAAILASIRAGKRVGVTASGHTVIRELLRKCCEAALRDGDPLRARHIQKPDDADAETDGDEPEPLFTTGKDYAPVLAGLRDGSLQLVGGTSFAWSRDEFRGSVDLLVVDEAAQISLANVLAVSSAAPRLMLLGDPAQLEQPQRGVHPSGAGVSSLEYLLGDARTMPQDLGVFLRETRRLHPSVCKFTSNAFYDGRLEALTGLGAQRIQRRVGSASETNTADAALLSGSGLRFVPVEHRGNTHRCDEEVERIAGLVATLLDGSWEYSDAVGRAVVLEPRHILVVAPYNAQVAALRRRLPLPVPVGTVDKFQGQEAPIVIYSMTSSSAGDAPRGFEFLYSGNRLNVATSRAQALVILVASPELGRAQCRTPSQMRLVNALCTYLECCEPPATPQPRPA